MRIAVSLPSLSPGSPVRRALEGTVAALARRGHAIEAFAEHDRIGEEPVAGHSGGREIPLYHYLRLRERHRAEPFDTALHPFGRDAHLYQGVFWCSRTLPGLFWVLDSGLHHFVLGDLGPRGLWPAYRRALAGGGAAAARIARRSSPVWPGTTPRSGAKGATVGAEAPTAREEHASAGTKDETARAGNGTPEETADALVDLVAAGWGTGLLYRRHDLLGWLAGDQPGAAAATVPLANDLREALPGRPVGTAPLPVPLQPAGPATTGTDPAAWERWDRRGPRVLVASLELASPVTAFQALAAVRESCPAAELRVCAPRLLVPGLLGPVASRLGLAGEVEWVPDPEPDEMRRRIEEADVVAWLRADPVAVDRLRLFEALAAGKVAFVLRAPCHDDLTPGGVVPVEPGRGLATGFRRALEELLDDEELRSGVQGAARLLASAAPTAVDAARALEHRLEETAAAGPPRLRDVSAATWETVEREIADKAVPPGAGPQVRRAVEECLGVARDTRPGRSSPRGNRN